MSAELLQPFPKQPPHFEFSQEQEDTAAQLFNLTKDITIGERIREEIPDPTPRFMGYDHPFAGNVETIIDADTLKMFKGAAWKTDNKLRFKTMVDDDTGKATRILNEEGALLADTVIGRANQSAKGELIVFEGRKK